MILPSGSCRRKSSPTRRAKKRNRHVASMPVGQNHSTILFSNRSAVISKQRSLIAAARAKRPRACSGSAWRPFTARSSPRRSRSELAMASFRPDCHLAKCRDGMRPGLVDPGRCQRRRLQLLVRENHNQTLHMTFNFNCSSLMPCSGLDHSNHGLHDTQTRPSRAC